MADNIWQAYCTCGWYDNFGQDRNAAEAAAGEHQVDPEYPGSHPAVTHYTPPED